MVEKFSVKCIKRNGWSVVVRTLGEDRVSSSKIGTYIDIK
jgi:hypothetical protein